MSRLIDADELKTHKFLSPQVRVLGGRRNRDVIVAAYQQGWNDAIDAIIDNAPTVEPKLSDEHIEKIADLLETEWGYEGIREDVARIMRGGRE